MLVAVVPIDDPEPDAAARVARLRAGLPDERPLLESLSEVLRDLRRAAAEEEKHLDLDAGWDRVQSRLAEGSPPNPS